MKLSVCDDNREYRALLAEQVQKACAKRGTPFSVDAFSPEELSERLDSGFDYDVIFLDIEMGSYDGIELARRINEVNLACSIVFVTNHLNLATEVYDVHHTYFILKSELDKRLPRALDRAIGRIPQNHADQIVITTRSHKLSLQTCNIIYADVYGHKLTIHHTGDKVFSTYQTLKWFQKQLPDFIKIHNSFLVNPAHIRSLNNGACLLSNGVSLPCSRSCSKQAAAMYSQYLASLF